MATRRFCDLCDKILTPEDDKAFVRFLITPNKEKISAHVMILNKDQHVVTDVCNGCKQTIVVNGDTDNEMVQQQALATLQSTSAMTGSSPTPPIPGNSEKVEIRGTEPSVKKK